MEKELSNLKSIHLEAKEVEKEQDATLTKGEIYNLLDKISANKIKLKDHYGIRTKGVTHITLTIN